MNTEQTETEKEIAEHIVEFVQQQLFETSFKGAKELQAQNEVKILQLNQRFGADLVKKVLKGMLNKGEGDSLAYLN